MIDWIHVDDLTTNIAVSFSFIPSTGNKYFIAAGDECLKLFDFEAGKLIQTWAGQYSSLCDCVKVIDFVNQEKEENEFYLISKGVELMDDNEQILSPNKCILHKLTMPTEFKGEWTLTEISRFSHDKFQCNIWFTKFSSNGRYLVCSTTVGQVFIWNLKTKELTAVLQNHSAEVRDILFHPTKPILITSGGDSGQGDPTIFVYTTGKEENMNYT